MTARLLGDDPKERVAALIALEAGAMPVDAEVCHALIELLGDSSKEINRRAAGVLAAAAADPAHRATIERSLADPDPRRRWCAAFALSRADDFGAAVAGVAIDTLAADDGDVRWAAAEIACEAVRRAPELIVRIAAAAEGRSAEQRKMALYCLRDLGAVDAPTFAAALDDVDRGVRLAGLAGLARCERMEGAAIERLLECRRADSDDGVRRAAVATVARLSTRLPAVADALAALDSGSAREAAKAHGPARGSGQPSGGGNDPQGGKR